MSNPDPGSGNMKDDVACLRAYVEQGDVRLLDPLIQAHWQACCRLARSVGMTAADAEDVAQQTFVAVVEGAAGFAGDRGSGGVRGWIFGIAINQARMHLRSEGRRRRRQEQAGRGMDMQDQDPAADLVAAERAASIAAAVADLPDHYRLPLHLRFLEGLSNAEVAQILDRKEETVRRQINRGLHRMRERLVRAGIALSLMMLMRELQAMSAWQGAWRRMESGVAVSSGTVWSTSLAKLTLTGVSMLVLMAWFLPADPMGGSVVRPAGLTTLIGGQASSLLLPAKPAPVKAMSTPADLSIDEVLPFKMAMRQIDGRWTMDGIKMSKAEQAEVIYQRDNVLVLDTIGRGSSLYGFEYTGSMKGDDLRGWQLTVRVQAGGRGGYFMPFLFQRRSDSVADLEIRGEDHLLETLTLGPGAERVFDLTCFITTVSWDGAQAQDVQVLVDGQLVRDAVIKLTDRVPLSIVARNCRVVIESCVPLRADGDLF